MQGQFKQRMEFGDASGTALLDVRECKGSSAACDPASLYDKLENVVLPLFCRDRDRFLDVMRHVIALNGPFLNTQRMVLQ